VVLRIEVRNRLHLYSQTQAPGLSTALPTTNTLILHLTYAQENTIHYFFQMLSVGAFMNVCACMRAFVCAYDCIRIVLNGKGADGKG
jgi:hypothetical protein